MESSPSQDLGLTDTHDTLSTLDYIVHFLHTEGFYAAEEALLREIENRYPEGDEALHTSPSRQSVQTAAPEQSSNSVAGADVAEQSSRWGLPTAFLYWEDTAPVEVCFTCISAVNVQSWRLAADTGGHTDSASAQTESAAVSQRPCKSTSRFVLPSVCVRFCHDGPACTEDAVEISSLTPSGHAGLQGAALETHKSDSDEYSDDDDPGYSRQDIRGQEAFISRELDLSDDEGSHRGPLSFQSPSPLIKPGSSSGKASSYMAEPPGLSVHGSEANSDLSHSTSHQPEHSSAAAAPAFNLTLRPDPNILGTADANTDAATAQDTSRTEQSSASSASFTGTDKSRRNMLDDSADGPAPDSTSQPASDAGAEGDAEDLTPGSIVHQTSGIRYLLDGMMEKVSEAFSRHQPRATPRPTHDDAIRGDADGDNEHTKSGHEGTSLPALNHEATR